jgi:molecular chaperone HtpG
MSADLITKAEELADQSRQLPEFKNVSLPGIKEQVAHALKLIGRDGIFSTYTAHDISHINAMLKMLDWLVPDSTRGAMTSVDWLLVVLAIYLHDLGMVTTNKEYEKRQDNQEFVSWKESLTKTADGRDYVARTNRMNSEEKERFFFQEFIRRQHPQRIREWITGRYPEKWAGKIQPIATTVSELLKVAPPRFREYLGLVCESHHRADIDRIEKYPLVARFGNDTKEIANVQYAAVLLRTTDLLHVTKDRTPSVMYQTVKFSDPKSVEEWDKQLGTFAVGPKGRKLDESDPESAVIVINADFTEERPLFALQEYVAYADAEIKQSNRWITKSAENPDGKDYKFPWNKVEGDVRLEGVPPQPMRFELDRGRLLDLLVGHTIYNEPTVAIRELLQNGIDAVRYQTHLEKRAESESNTRGKVVVSWDPKSRNLAIQDNGVGMDRDVIRHHLMNVGSSYYNTPQFESEHGDFVPISRFGIGILTCFMISDDIEIVTFQKQRGFRIRMTSVKSTYLLRELEKGDKLVESLEPHGTRVTLRLRDTVDLSEKNVLDIVKYWVILPECSVEYNEPNKQSVKIGLESVKQALVSYHFPAERINSPWIELQTIVKNHTGENKTGSFELAFGVASGFFPERSFARTLEPTAPKVCIEGIRVSDQLPGFEMGAEPLGALLSVRGSRRFRTTVSRAGLEVDDEYKHVAEMCTRMLFEHVDEEAERISNCPGTPLSQAANGVRYLVQQLLQAGIRSPIHEQLMTLANDRRSLVIERVDSQGDKRQTSRTLISPNVLCNIPFFWTIESRSVDSLGTISLDLGRELSLNEFLLALAPDATQLLKYSPIVPEAHRSQRAIRSSHYPISVEFSRHHRQTAIKWIPKQGAVDFSINLHAILEKVKLQALLAIMRQDPDSVNLASELIIPMDIAEIVGDDNAVMAVASRMGSILKTGSDLGRIWQSIYETFQKLRDCGSPDDILCALHMARSFANIVTAKGANYERRPGSNWRERIGAFAAIRTRVGIREELPSDLRDSTFEGAVFDATSYWRDWDRTR